VKVALIFPPSWTPSMPHLATPTLTAYLRSQGVDVVQRDLNVEFMDWVLSEDHLERTVSRVRRLYRHASRRHSTLDPTPPRELVTWAQEHGSVLATKIEQAKRVMRSHDFYDAKASRRAFEVIIASLQLASVPYYPASLDLSTYVSPVPEDSSAALLQLVRAPRRNLFYRFLEKSAVPSIAAERPDLIGISIATMAQFTAALTLAHLLKEHGVPAHITVGGPHVSMLRQQIADAPGLFDMFDSATVFGGEAPLLQLARVIEHSRSLSQVPNLLYREGARVIATERAAAVPLHELPTPDFDGLPLELYLVPEPVLPLLTARGCYHGDCAFCNVGYGEPNRFEQLPPERIVFQMQEVQQKYGTRHIFFSDEAITPRNLRSMALALKDGGEPIHWITCARMERALNKGLLRLLVEGGCRMLLYGLESGCPRIVSAMHKGTTVDKMSRVLREGAEVGLWNHVFFFFGFPGESMEEAQTTVDFIYAHQECIHSGALGTFTLERYAPAHLHPDQYGIRQVATEEGRDLAIYFDYQVTRGLDENTAEIIVQRLMDTFPTKENPQYYAHDTYRFLYASRLADEGLPYPTWLGD